MYGTITRDEYSGKSKPEAMMSFTVKSDSEEITVATASQAVAIIEKLHGQRFAVTTRLETSDPTEKTASQRELEEKWSL